MRNQPTELGVLPRGAKELTQRHNRKDSPTIPDTNSPMLGLTSSPNSLDSSKSLVCLAPKRTALWFTNLSATVD